MTAASVLVGLTLDGGWRVTELVKRPVAATGGMFSYCYLAQKADQVAFVKAFDFSDAFVEDAQETIRRISLLTSSYENERDILDHCRERKFSKVSTGRLDLLGFSDTWNGDGRRGVMSVPAFPGLIFYRYFRWFLPA